MLELKQNWVTSTVLGIDLCVTRIQTVLVTFIFWYDVVTIWPRPLEHMHHRWIATYSLSPGRTKVDLSLAQVAHGNLTALGKSR